MTRKIVQIAAISPGRASEGYYNASAVALADDGTVWYSAYSPADECFDLWKSLPKFPATDEEAQKLIDEADAKYKGSNSQKPKKSLWQRFGFGRQTDES